MDQQLWLALVTTLIGILVIMFGAMIRRLFNKQDELEKTQDELEKSKANSSSTDKRFEAMLAEIKEERNELKDHAKKDDKVQLAILTELRTVSTNVAHLVGRFEGQNGKHP